MQTVKRKCQIHLIQIIEKAQDCFILHNNILSFNNEYFTNLYLKSISAHAYHLYITSDDEIELSSTNEGWFIRSHSMTNNVDVVENPIFTSKYKYKKIIATTDKSLKFQVGNEDISNMPIFAYLSQPSPQFIRTFVNEYNKKNIIKEVMIEYEEINNNSTIISNEAIAEVYALHAEEPNAYENKLKELGGPNRTILIPKIHKDNTITIRKIKDNWNREEVANILRNFRNDILVEVSNGTVSDFTEKWIEKNL